VSEIICCWEGVGNGCVASFRTLGGGAHADRFELEQNPGVV
jgi:hypothetical protein